MFDDGAILDRDGEGRGVTARFGQERDGRRLSIHSTALNLACNASSLVHVLDGVNGVSTVCEQDSNSGSIR